MLEHKKRSLIKAISWRAVGTLDTFVIAWIVTGEPLIAGTISVIEVLTKIVIYYLHERVWSKIKWGVEKNSA
jgi:uncharacterized membrane protein